jgi:predicted aldo/keto reductase-like oxidoreductase
MALDHYFTLGRSGLRVSRLALGTMTFGTDGMFGSWGSEEGTARSVFDRYVAAGGNFIDTADFYTKGTSEQARSATPASPTSRPGMPRALRHGQRRTRSRHS